MIEYTKEQVKAMKPYEVKRAAASTNVVQNIEILSAETTVIKFIAATPGSVGYASDGTTFHYTAGSHMTHQREPGAFVDLNHHVDEIIGLITQSETDHLGNLIVSTELDAKYDYFSPIVKANRHDGVSIETIVTSGYWIDEKNVLVSSYILTGIAFLFSKPPACDKDICHVLSADTSVQQHGELHEILADIEKMDEEHLRESYKNVLTELDARNAVKPTTTESPTVKE